MTTIHSAMVPSTAAPRGGCATGSGRARAAWLSHHVLPHEPALRSWLSRRPVRGLEADDIIQETYAVLAGLAAVDHIEAPRAYAFQVAQSLIRRHLRRARIIQFDAFDDHYLLSVAAEEPSPERQTSSRQELDRVLHLISALPSRCREAFVMRKLEGFSQRDVARTMGIAESTVEKHIGRALRAMAAGIKDCEIAPQEERCWRGSIPTLSTASVRPWVN